MQDLLIVDDNFEIINTIRIMLEKNFKISFEVNVGNALKNLESNSYDIAILDVDLPDGNGLTVLEWLKNNRPDTEVIMMSGVATVNDAFNAVKMGAYDFIDKPVSQDKLAIVLNNLTEKKQLIELVGKSQQNHFLTKDEIMKKLLAEAKKISMSNLNILITGESGTGKEMLASYIHANSKRRLKPFVKVNCAAIPESLFESEFFGHKKGAFTGAVLDKKGKFELADKGTIFLDEVGELPLLQQTKLLRVLEEMEFTRLGSEKTTKVDVRVISATNQNLEQMVKEGSFREDLYYRLNVVNYHLLPLRERKADIAFLANIFLTQIAQKEGLSEKYFSTDARQKIEELPFKGNIRELKNLVHKIYFLSDGEEISALNLEKILKPVNDDNNNLSNEIFSQTIPLNEAKKNLEKEYILTQLKKHDYNVSNTAIALKILPNNLFRKIKDLKIKY